MKIDMIEREALPVILRTGTPAGLWLCRLRLLPPLYYGIKADGNRADVCIGSLWTVMRFLLAARKAARKCT